MSSDLPGNNIEGLRALVNTARQISSQIDRQRSAGSRPQRSRGPVASKLRVKYYLLPEGSAIPTLSGVKDAQLIAAHHQCNYGFPFGRNKPYSCNLGLTKEQYDSFLRTLYPHQPQTTSFCLYKCDRRKNLTRIENGQDELMRYTGVVFLKVGNGNPDNHESDTGAQHVSREVLQIDDRNSDDSDSGAAHENIGIDAEVVQVQIDLPSSSNSVHEDRSEDQSRSDEVIIVETDERRRIILDQDISFVATLRLDRERDRLRREARERLSLRAQRRRLEREEQARQAMEDRQQVLQSLGEEPEAGIHLVFRLPEANISRRFSQTDPCKILYTFVEASAGKPCRIIGHEGLVPNDETKLEDFGIRHSTTLNVEELNEDEVAAGTDSEEYNTASEYGSNTDGEENEFHLAPIVSDIESLQDKARSVKENLMPEKVVTVRRKHVVEDVLDAYRANEDLEHHDIKMVIEGEPAIDLDGVKREVFCSFFTLILMKFFVGHEEKVPKMDTELLCSGVFKVIGRILVHAFVLVGYFPVNISKAAVLTILTGNCQLGTVVESFRALISKRACSVVEKVINGHDLHQGDKLLFLSTLAEYGMCRTPMSKEYKQSLYHVSQTAVLHKPLAAWSQIHQGMSSYGALFRDVTEHTLMEMFEKMRPTRQEVIQRIRYEFSDEVNSRIAEERVKDFLELYIEDFISDEDLIKLLQFWTAANTLVVPTLTVAFNSLEGTSRRPFVNACVAQLNLSRLYLSCDEFCQEFHIYLRSESAQEFDSF